MIRKDYELIASKLSSAYQRTMALRNPGNIEALEGFYAAYHAVVDALSEDNPQFSAERFYEAVFEKEECIDD